MLWNASEGNPSGIPSSYLRHLDHTWDDGDISLAGCLDRFDCSEEITDLDIEEAIELLGKVNPEDWPDVENIKTINIDELLFREDEGETEDYNESEHELSEKVEKVLTHCIESVFGEKVTKVRTANGKYFTKDAQYGQDGEGSFKGSFEFNGSKFSFQIYPDESGWSVSYRLNPESLDSLPPIPPEDGKQEVEERKTRNKGWR